MSRRFDFMASLCFLFIGIFFFSASMRLAGNVIGGTVTPATFPQAFGGLLIFLSVLLMFETFKKQAKQSEEREERTYYRRFFIILLAMVVYIALIEPLGFVMSTFLFLLVAFQAMSRGEWLKTVLIAGGFSLVIYFVFIKLLEASVQAWPSFLS
ncbi:MAG: tripartite tricarboxylate transporter TctB family protein [Formosimonas sp.]